MWFLSAAWEGPEKGLFVFPGRKRGFRPNLSASAPGHLGLTVLCGVWGALCGAGCLAAAPRTSTRQTPVAPLSAVATKNVCGHRQPPGGELALVWGLGIGTPWPGPGVLATPGASPLGPPGHTAVPGARWGTWGAARAQCLGESDVQGFTHLSVWPQAAEARRGLLWGRRGAAT